jgi:hypothetical protein
MLDFRQPLNGGARKGYTMETETLTEKQQAIKAMWQDHSRLMLNFYEKKELLQISNEDISNINITILGVIAEALDLDDGESY